MSLVPATFLLIMAISSAVIVWLVVREVAKRIGGPTVAAGARRARARRTAPLEAS